MLKLVTCEFAKLKRKKFILLVILSAFLFPVPVTVMLTTPQMAERFDSDAEVFNACFQFIMGYGVSLLLPCVIGIVAAMLFFMERDNDTFKNLRTIPVTGTQMILAKILVL
ncbi:MAG: ABC transporter permease, partial [Lachnospiraceae bacterium]|nr:ABC transporter permease [Lachnospiraceae bacterium]